MSRLHGTACQRQCDCSATKLSRLNACEDRKIVRWCRTQAPSHNSPGVGYGRVNEAGVSTAVPNRSVVQYFAVEWTRDKVALRNVVAPAPQPEPANGLKSAKGDVNFFRSDSRCRRYVSALFNVTPRYVGSEQKGRALLWLNFSSRLASLLLRWKTANTAFVVLRFNFQVWAVFTHGCHILA